MDPNLVQIRCDRDALAHNVTFVEGYFPRDIERVRLPEGEAYDVVFLDGDHRYEGVSADLEALPSLLSDGGYVLMHDACNSQVEQAIADIGRRQLYADCGRIGRARNDLNADDLWGGLHLLRKLRADERR
jgi:cephalosporin hydroxylase